MATGEVIEQTADAIEDVANHVEEVAEATRRLTGRDAGFLFTGVSIGIAAGFAAGYFIANHRLKTQYSKLANDEITRVREHYYAKTVAAEPKPNLETAVEEKVAPERPTRPPVVVDEPRRSNVFPKDVPEEWDYAVEIRGRTKEVPYIIHIDEFRENSPEHDQVTYTYYEVDDVLADSRDTPIEDMDEVIGLGNLGRWGHGSNDSNIVYIRNERLTLDFEIVRDPGSHAEQVSGTIRHSATRRRRPRRKFDDE